MPCWNGRVRRRKSLPSGRLPWPELSPHSTFVVVALGRRPSRCFCALECPEFDILANVRTGTQVRRKHLPKHRKACKMLTKIGAQVRVVAEPIDGCLKADQLKDFWRNA